MPFFENPMKMTISSSDYTPFPVNFWEFRNLLVWNAESILKKDTKKCQVNLLFSTKSFFKSKNEQSILNITFVHKHGGIRFIFSLKTRLP